MAVRKDEYQLDIQFITDESRAFAKTIQANKGFITDLQKAQKEGKGVADVMTQIANNGKKVQGLDLTNVAPAQLIARARQLGQILKQVPESAPGVANLRSEYKALNDRLAQVRQQTRGVVDANKGMESSFGALRNRFLGIVAAAGALVGVFRGITNTAADFQKFEAVLTNALGSNSAAQKAIKQISDFAARTPFQVDALIDSYIKLVNRGFKPTTAELENLGDLAASQGKEFGQLTEAILDAGTGEFERLKEFGIQAKSSGDQVQFSFKGQTVEVEKTQEAITNAILAFGDLEGVQGSTAAISKTLGGQISNLTDRLTQLYKNLGEGFIGRIIANSVGAIGQLVDQVNAVLKPMESMIQTHDQLASSVSSLESNLNPLLARYDELTGQTSLTEAEQKELSEVIKEIGKLTPIAITEIDKYGNALNINAAASKAFLQAEKDRLKFVNEETIASLEKEIDAMERRREALQKMVDQGARVIDQGQGFNRTIGNDEIREFSENIGTLASRISGARQELARLNGESLDTPEEEVVTPPTTGGGGGGKKKKTLAERLQEELTKAKEVYAIRAEVLEQQLIREEITEKEYGLATLQLQQENYAEQLRLYEQFNQERTAAAEKVRTEFLRNDTLLSRETTAISGLVSPELPEQVERRSINAGLDEVANEEERAQQRLQEALNGQLINIDQFELGRLELKRQALDAEQELLRTGTEAEIRLAAEKRDQIAAIDQQIFEKKQELATRKQQLEEEVQAALRNVQEEGVNFIIGLLGKDEEARKRNANAIKAFETGNAIVAGLSEISQIRLAARKEAAAVAAIPGAAALVNLKAIGQAIAAGVRTAATVSQIRSAKFERGGLAKSGFFGGRSHAAGGVKGYFDDGTQIEVEKDEAFAIVNKRSSNVLRQLSGLNVAGGGVPFFAGGGLLAPSTTPIAGVGAAPVNDGQLLAQLQQLNGNFMAFPTRLRTHVVYTDIEDAGNDLNTVRAAAEV